MLEELKRIVYEENLELPKRGLIKYTWGNVSQADHEQKLFVIKPSGVDYDVMTPEDMVVCDFDGNIVEGTNRPSSDMLTHAALAQAGKEVSCFGTTHADTFYGTVPCARYLTSEEVEAGYEANTGEVIVETLTERKIQPLAVPGILLKGHGPFTWGKDAKDAVMHAVVLEEVCKMNFYTMQLNSDAPELPNYILEKHYQRKHGKDAYYGQK